MFARLRLALRRGGPAILAVTTGESLNEVQRYARRVTDIVELRDGESFTTAPTGFRYAKVMALSCDPVRAAAELEPVELQEIYYPVERQGQFSCSDALLNQIWALSARTVHRCMQTEVWDGIKRDQLPWMGDLYTEALAIYHLFGDARLFGGAAIWRRPPGAAHPGGAGRDRPWQPAPARAAALPGLAAIWKSPGGSHPGTGSGDINGIPTYTHWWVLGLRDYTLYSGDTSLVQDVAQELEIGAGSHRRLGWSGWAVALPGRVGFRRLGAAAAPLSGKPSPTSWRARRWRPGSSCWRWRAGRRPDCARWWNG